MSFKKNTTRQISSYYHLRILECVYRHSSVSRDTIASETGLGRSITYSHVRALLERGVLRKTGVAQSNGGRKTDLLSVNPNIGSVIGAACLKNELIWVISDLSGEISRSESARLAGTENSSEIIEALIAGIRRIARESKTGGSEIIAVGVGVPGLVDPERKNAVANIHVDDWSDIPIGRMISERLGVPVFIESNSHLTALAEKKFGQAGDTRDFLTINISNGVGMGIFINDHLYSGAQGRAGEIGHFQIDPKGPLCRCGNRGCLESLVSIPALVEEAESSIRQGVFSAVAHPSEDNVEFSRICDAAGAGDKLALKILRTAARNVGLSLGNTINLLNPEMIIVNGEIRATGDVFLSSLIQMVEEVRSLSDTTAKIVYSNTPWPMTIAQGGVALGLERIFIDREVDLL